MRWAAYYSEYLFFGTGRIIRTISVDSKLHRQLHQDAAHIYESSIYIRYSVPQDVFVYTHAAIHAMRYFFPSAPASFTTMQDFYALLKPLTSETELTRLYNCITACYADSGETAAETILNLYSRNVLLDYPADRMQLYSQSVQRQLPGALLFFLGGHRPVTPTTDREIRIESAYGKEARS